MLSGQSLFQWIDLLWVPAALLAVHRGQRIKAVLFVLVCVFVLRLQLQFMAEIGYPDGFLGWMDSSLYVRGLLTYSVVILLFLLISHYSPRTDLYVYMAAAISMFILGFCISTAVMLL